MDMISETSSQKWRIDPLTGVGNPLAFFEWLQRYTDQPPFQPFTLLFLDIVNLRHLNDSKGFAAGDAAVRWATLVLTEEAGACVYRVSGDEFVGVLVNGSRKDHEKLAENVYRRLSEEAELVQLEPPGASLGVIHFSVYDGSSPEDVLSTIYGALVQMKQDPDHTFKVFDANSTEPVIPKRGLINDMVRRMIALGSMLDKSHQLAYTDSISGLPNMLAAIDACEGMIRNHSTNSERFGILLIDGDDLSKYNKVGYQAGDEMIERLGKTLTDEMRPGDFVARWRSGDEFIILLNEASPELALSIGDRLRRAVKGSSSTWVYPITISIGVAVYPDHGGSARELIDAAEQALSSAKALGKNQVHLHRPSVAPLGQKHDLQPKQTIMNPDVKQDAL